MFDYPNFKVMHLHGDERFPMDERSPHDAAEIDVERRWAKGGRIFRCTRCSEEVVVIEPGQETPTTQRV
jgi:hypothetical protein